MSALWHCTNVGSSFISLLAFLECIKVCYIRVMNTYVKIQLFRTYKVIMQRIMCLEQGRSISIGSNLIVYPTEALSIEKMQLIGKANNESD